MPKYGDKEPIYDQKISPLMNQIIDICKAEGINMVASFQLRSEHETPEESNFLCTTLLPTAIDHYPEKYKALTREIVNRPFIVAISIQKGGAPDETSSDTD